MKRYAIITVLLAAVFMSGCLVTSLHPFYKSKDKIYDETLLGHWIDSDSSIWIIEQNKETKEFLGPEFMDSTYLITYYEDDDAVSYLKGTLFQLNGNSYVDFFPADENHFTSGMTGMHHVPVHTLARLASNRDSLMFFWFGEDWLNELFKEKRIRIDHETIDQPGNYQSNVLTADTEDLQKFIKKYMETESLQIEETFASGDEADEHLFLKLKPYDGPVPDRK